MSNIYDDFKQYRDAFGLNGLNTDGVSGQSTQNGALFTLEYLICLLNDPTVSEQVKREEIERLRIVYFSLETFPGVTSRKPADKEFDSMDNVGAIATFSALFDHGFFSERSYRHGESTKAQGIDLTQDADMSKRYYRLAWVLNGFKAPRFFWNNNNPNLFCFFGWHGRSPGHTAYLKLTAGKFVGPLGMLIILISQFLGCFSSVENTDARKLPYMNWQFLKTRGFFWRMFYKLWCFILTKQYPDGMISVYDKYYTDPNHPIKRYSQKFIP